MKFLDCIENSDGATVIVHVFDSRLEACNEMDEILIELAEKFVFTKFIKVMPRDIGSDFDLDVLPSLLVYSNGELLNSLIRVDMRFPRGKFNYEGIEEILLQYLS